MHGLEPRGQSRRREPRPATVGGGEILIHYWLTSPVAVEARPFSVLDLEELQHSHGLAGGSHHSQLAVRRGQHDPGSVDVEDLDAMAREAGEQIDRVEVVDQGVGELDERPGEHCFSGHRISRSRRTVPAWFDRSES